MELFKFVEAMWGAVVVVCGAVSCHLLWPLLIGLEEQGLYRIVGVSSKVAKLTTMGLGKLRP